MLPCHPGDLLDDVLEGLKVYLGAAPGVGKTYRMLDEARRRASRRADVVVGFVECHGRRWTQAMCDDLEVVPRARCVYRGDEFEEMDLDAVLERRPRVAIVDEFAHTNVPGGGRSPKRWQDVESRCWMLTAVMTSMPAASSAASLAPLTRTLTLS